MSTPTVATTVPPPLAPSRRPVEKVRITITYRTAVTAKIDPWKCRVVSGGTVEWRLASGLFGRGIPDELRIVPLDPASWPFVNEAPVAHVDEPALSGEMKYPIESETVVPYRITAPCAERGIEVIIDPEIILVPH